MFGFICSCQSVTVVDMSKCLKLAFKTLAVYHCHCSILVRIHTHVFVCMCVCAASLNSFRVIACHTQGDSTHMERRELIATQSSSIKIMRTVKKIIIMDNSVLGQDN